MRDKRFTCALAGAMLAGLLAVAACQHAGAVASGGVPAREPAGISHPTLVGRVMVGYQGWYRTPGDGAGMGWAHYAGADDAFAPGQAGIDYWPDMREAGAGERFATPFRLADGRPAEVFSSHNPATVDRHFRWMREYGIDGAFVQRFAAPIVDDDPVSQQRRRATDDVLAYALAGAAHHGRSLAVMYDLTGLRAGAMDLVIADWKRITDRLNLRRSAAYQFHRGRPVVAVWGVGFNDGRAYTLAECARFIAFLHNDPVYGGNCVLLGVPTWWRDGTVDATSDPALREVLAQADILSPWTPGRYYDIGGVAVHAGRFWRPDLAWCAARGIDYMPVVFPGFRWRNLKRARGGIDRADGRFLWAQYRAAAGAGATMIYQAMFDEMDEGTQIFKTAPVPPAGGGFGSDAPLPADFYLQLVGLAARRLRAGGPWPEKMPRTALPAALAAYLDAGDTVYAAAADSAAAQRRFYAVEDALTGDGRLDGARVSAEGRWSEHHRWSDAPDAALSWDLPAPTRGPATLSLRYPGDPNEDHAAAARLTVSQGGRLLLSTTMDLRRGALRWNEVGTVTLQPDERCIVRLASAGTGSLVPFEARLAPR